MTEARYYRRSGRIGFRGPLLMALRGLAGAIVIGAIYGYGIWYLRHAIAVLVQLWPLTYELFAFARLLLPLATLAYGVAIGLIVGQAALRGKVRNRAFVGWFGVAVGVLAVYTSWVFWLLVWSEHSYFSPLSEYWWFSAIAEAADEGIDYGDETAPGGELYFEWSVEAVMIVVSSWFMAWVMVDASEHTFCEACEKWAKDVYWSPELEAIGDEEGFRAELEADPLGCLVAIPQAKPVVPGTTSRIRIQACRKCMNFFSLDVQKIERSRNKEGEEKSRKSVLVDNLLIDKRTHDGLARHFPNAGKPKN